LYGILCNQGQKSIKQAPSLLGVSALKKRINHRVCYQDVFEEPDFPYWNPSAKIEINKLLKEVLKELKNG